MPDFVQRLHVASQTNRSLLCVGLDPDPSLMPIDDVAGFNRAIVDATKDLVCAYKPNMSFYEALGLPGLAALEDTVSYVHKEAPQVVLLGDAKRGDIGSSNRRYAKALFEVWGFDAVTINAWGGGETLEPFFEYRQNGVFIWCRSSNPGAGEIQDVAVSFDGEERRLFEMVAERANQWNGRGNVGLVVGATYPSDLEVVRALCPSMPILAPGVGAQAGDLEATVTAGTDASGRNLMISSSRSILYASPDAADFAAAARAAAGGLRERINQTLAERGKGWQRTSVWATSSD